MATAPAEPVWAPELREKAEFYAQKFGVRTAEMQVALHGIFSMLSLHGVGPYATKENR